MNNLTKIQNIAESKMRSGGFNSFSFREIASEVGIKSSSVHYHFPTKLDLAVSVAKRYTERFMLTLENEQLPEGSAQQAIIMYIDLFEAALKQDCKMCLCGLLAAESSDLPEQLQLEAKRFFELNLVWLTEQFKALYKIEEGKAHEKATFYVSALEGAMLTSQVCNNTALFDATVKQLKGML
jgi:TetR/AcrR family transcriptional regulator, transcriptional repressor for nem operon